MGERTVGSTPNKVDGATTPPVGTSVSSEELGGPGFHVVDEDELFLCC